MLCPSQSCMEPALEVLSWCLNSVLYKEKIQLKKLHHTSYKKKLQFIQKQIAKKQFAVLAGWRFKKKAAICISAPIANKILFLRDNDCRIRSLKNNGSLRELAQNMMPFQGTNLKPGITVSDMRSNSSNRNNDVNNNAARLASS